MRESHPEQRIEPVRNVQNRQQPIAQQIAMADVRQLVQDDVPLLRWRQRFEQCCRHQDSRPPNAMHRRRGNGIRYDDHRRAYAAWQSVRLRANQRGVVLIIHDNHATQAESTSR